MNVIRVTADTFRRDHLGDCGNDYIKISTLDGLARGGTLFERRAWKRRLAAGLCRWLYSMDAGMSKLSDLSADPNQANDKSPSASPTSASYDFMGMARRALPESGFTGLAGSWGLHFAHIAFAESAYSHGDSPESEKSSPSMGFQTAG